MGTRTAPGRRASTQAPKATRRRTGRVAGVLRRLAIPAMLLGATVAVLGLGVLPTRSYLDKRAEVQEVEVRLASLQEANAAASADAARLDSDAEIERLARRDFGLAKPGEETYVVLPPPAEPVTVPDGWPFDKLQLTLEADG